MNPQAIRDALHTRPFEPFRLVMTDGASYDIYHPDLLMVGQNALIVGLASDPHSDLFERTIKVALLHVVRLEPLANVSPTSN